MNQIKTIFNKKSFQKKPKSTIDSSVYPMIVSIVILLMTTLTILHEMIHSITGLLFGWNFVDMYIGIMTGYTVMDAYSNEPLKLWIYYIAPPLILCSTSIIAVMLYPKRLIGIWAIVILFLNIASFVPLIVSSDGQNALDVMLTSSNSLIFFDNPISLGQSITNAFINLFGLDLTISIFVLSSYLIAYGMMLLSFIGFGTVIYIMFDTDEKDTKRRAYDVLH
jgi:hypothetical protein